MEQQKGTHAVKVGLAQMLKGGVIMDVVNVEQARIAEEAGAVAVMVRVPAEERIFTFGPTIPAGNPARHGHPNQT